jgi:citrate synthase
VGQLAERCSFEEVAFLLWHQRLPVKDELVALKKDLAAAREIPQPILDLMKASPRDAHPMTVLRTAVSALGAFDLDAEDLGPEALLGESIRLLAEVPMLAAAWHRIRSGKEPVKPDPKLGTAAHLLWSLHGKRPSTVAERALDAALIAHADHGMSSSTSSHVRSRQRVPTSTPRSPPPSAPRGACSTAAPPSV